MSSQNYKVAWQKTSGEISIGVDLYKSSFTVPGETTYIWRLAPKSLSDILKEETLPLVVKLNKDNKDDETPIDLQQPFLLYKEVKAKKLHARNIRTKEGIRESRVIYQSVGPYVTFPESYIGYFRPIDMPDLPMELMSNVARFMPRALISLTPCEGFQCLTGIGVRIDSLLAEKDCLYQERLINSGLYYPKNILEETITYINKKKAKKRKLIRCLSCRDFKNRIVLFPLDVTGKFYLAKPKLKPSKRIGNMIDKTNRAFKWTEFDPDVLKGFRVKMVCGNTPKEECQFTGTLEFSHFTEEHTVVGCTMTPNPRLFEMPVTTEPFFIVALNSDDLDSSSLQQKSLKFAKNECDGYMQCAKVKRDYDIEDNESEL